MTVAIIKYGMGNVASVQKALAKLNYKSIVTDDIDELKKADVLLLPGVGSFKKGIENLNNAGLIGLLTDEVVHKKKPFIGICLGMQLIASYGTEPERIAGLGWIEGEVVKFREDTHRRVPHLGWNTVSVNNDNTTYKQADQQDFYFIHSYHFKAKNNEDVSLLVNYGEDIVAGVSKDNIHAMQFHPEKSQKVGMHLLKTILESYAKK